MEMGLFNTTDSCNSSTINSTVDIVTSTINSTTDIVTSNSTITASETTTSGSTSFNSSGTTILTPSDSKPHHGTIDAIRFYSSILATIFICLGICGNTISILVWKRARMRSSTGTYLIGQAIADSCLLVFFFTVENLPALAPDATLSEHYGIFYAYLGYPFFYYFLVCSIWFTVGVTIDRFIQIKRPLQAKNLCNERRAVIGLVLLAVLNFIINIPHFFTYEPVISKIKDSQRKSYRLSQFGQSAGSHHYEFWVHCVFLVLGPWLLCLILNTLIIRQVVNVNAALDGRRTAEGGKKAQRSENQLTKILLSVSITFLILIFPECIAKCFFMLKAGDPEVVPKALSIAKTGVVINSSINFCLYCLSGRKFRKELRILFASCFHSDYDVTGSSMYSNNSTSTLLKTKQATAVTLMSEKKSAVI